MEQGPKDDPLKRTRLNSSVSIEISPRYPSVYADLVFENGERMPIDVEGMKRLRGFGDYWMRHRNRLAYTELFAEMQGVIDEHIVKAGCDARLLQSKLKTFASRIPKLANLGKI